MPNTTEDAYYNALLTRDAKFDGKFFFGVKTTGIYCRPICPAKPKRENVEFFSSAQYAEKAGYRPCLRCHPESAPDSPHWYASSSLVQLALNTILNDETAIELDQNEFAARFGLSARHLRRLFQTELGKTPAQIMQDKRLNLAQKLIVETDLAFVDIAFSAGFDSVRRFNDAIRQRFAKTPSQLRNRKVTRNTLGCIKFSASYRPPLDWQACLNYYQKHKVWGLEQFDNNCYQRIFQFENSIGIVTVQNNAAKNRLEISLQIDKVNAINYVLIRIKDMFDLSLDPIYVTSALEKQADLKQLAHQRHGTRLVRCWDQFELAVCAIIGQLISVKQANQLCEQLMRLYGEQRQNPFSGDIINFFPSAAILAKQSLAELKIPKTKKIAINQLAQQVLQGDIHFSSYQNPQHFKKKLMTIHGIGPWTADYIALRAIGDTDAFPSNDAYLKKQISDLNSIANLSPWRGYLATILYKYGDKLERKHHSS